VYPLHTPAPLQRSAAGRKSSWRQTNLCEFPCCAAAPPGALPPPTWNWPEIAGLSAIYSPGRGLTRLALPLL